MYIVECTYKGFKLQKNLISYLSSIPFIIEMQHLMDVERHLTGNSISIFCDTFSDADLIKLKLDDYNKLKKLNFNIKIITFGGR